MNNNYRIFNLKRAGENGKIILCKKCGNLLAIRFPQNTQHIYIQTVCQCGSTGYLSCGTKPDLPEYSIANYQNNNLTCSSCGNLLLHTTQNLVSFAFETTCSCGSSFNTKYESRRNAYSEIFDHIQSL